MSDIEDIRERKREQIKEELSGGSPSQSSNEPVEVGGVDEFERVTSDGVVLVDFYADWCGPCKMMEPVVEEIARETDATVAKVNIDHNQGLATQNNVSGVPTLMVYSGGKPVERVVGARNKSGLVGLLENYL